MRSWHSDLKSSFLCQLSSPRGRFLTGIGLAWEITAAWIALEIAVVTTALQVGYLSPLLLEGSRFLLAELFPLMFLRTLRAMIRPRIGGRYSSCRLGLWPSGGGS